MDGAVKTIPGLMRQVAAAAVVAAVVALSGFGCSGEDGNNTNRKRPKARAVRDTHERTHKKG